MIFANWETKENMKKYIPLIKVNWNTGVKSSGLPIAYDDKYLYISDRLNHSLVIGSTGCGKTQTITLPLLELANKAGESVVIHDTTTELYETTNEIFKENGYNVIKLNFDETTECNNWNPLDLPYRLYKDGNKDKAQDIIEDLAFYLFNDIDEVNIDSFWINSAINYFTGLTLYAFENEEKVNLITIRDLNMQVNESEKYFKDKLDKKSSAYINLSGVLNAPIETKGSIISVFSQKIKRFISKEYLNKLLFESDFDITNIAKEKTIIYVISGNSNNSEKLLPLLISQIYYAKDEYSRKEGKINIIIDNFFELYPIKKLEKILNYSREINITFTIMIRGFNDLKNKYGKENTEILKLCFDNIVYLLSKDIDTLEEISNMCGKTCENDVTRPLISIEELKTLKMFEAIILIPRLMPIKTKLLPYYEMKRN
jgi:type IV secretion system protein VirD4